MVMSDDKCPECDGPCKVDYKIGDIDDAENMTPHYRSTAAEQLAHVKTISQSMAEENDKLHKQLTDKERELEGMRNHALGIAKAALQPLQTKLTAANAVVELQEKLLDRLHKHPGAILDRLKKAKAKLHKLQGGE